MTYDIPTRKRWMRTIAVGDAVDVQYNDQLYRAKVIRIGKNVLWVSSFQAKDGTHMVSPRYNRKTGEGWGTALNLFPIDDSWTAREANDGA